MTKEVKIIGAGLAGCEAAWFLANRGVKVLHIKAKILRNLCVPTV